MYKIVFMGTPDFSVPILEALIEDERYSVIAAVTQPDRKVGRKRALTAPPVKQKALEYDIPVLQPEKLSGSAELQEIIEMKPDLLITAAYGQYVPTKLLHSPPFKAINVHASLLPKYRGAAPIHYALIKGEKETGVTIMYMEKEMDAGDILSTRTLPIEKTDTTGSLFGKLSYIGRDLLMDTLPSIFDKTITPVAQEELKVTYAPMISRSEEQINWNKPAKELENKIRGMNPFPGAYSYLKDERFKIWKAETITYSSQASPGTIVKLTKDKLWVKCKGETALNLLEVQPFGKPKMSVSDYLAGALNHLEEGIQFEEK